jgi:class 3 adenylate cyclase
LAVEYEYHSLEDFLISNQLSIDAVLDDGMGLRMPVKGREIHATVFFVDMKAFSARTFDMIPAETLIFVQWFFAWIGAAARRGKGILDKYIGDEMMIVFSQEFGSEDSFTEAVQTARWMADFDPWSFAPHIGIASGPVIVGYVGTTRRYNCSVVGKPVALAARCASVTAESLADSLASSIVFPASEWGDRDFNEVFPPTPLGDKDGSMIEQPSVWEMSEREVPLKNMGTIPVREVIKKLVNFATPTAEEAAKEMLRGIAEGGRYWPSGEGAEPASS